MDLQKKKSAFTLIELLVVITIIGILAVGGVTVYTAQIQKARDSTRINDVKSLQAASEQVYQDGGEYPHPDIFFNGDASVSGMSSYIERIPTDPKSGKTCSGNAANDGNLCVYTYATGVDGNGIDFGKYEYSNAFEADGNVKNRAANTADNGNDDDRFEVGIGVSTTTSYDDTLDSAQIITCTELDGATAVGATTLAMILDASCN